MKWFLLVVSVLMASVALAEGSFWSDPNRDGEGLILVKVQDKEVFAFFTFIDNGYSLPPVVSPAGPPYDVCSNCQAWFLGTAGVLYMSEAIDYPNTLKGGVNVEFAVGKYRMDEFKKGGYMLDIDCNDVLPPSLYMCNNRFYFSKHVFGN